MAERCFRGSNDCFASPGKLLRLRTAGNRIHLLLPVTVPTEASLLSWTSKLASVKSRTVDGVRWMGRDQKWSKMYETIKRSPRSTQTVTGLLWCVRGYRVNRGVPSKAHTRRAAHGAERAVCRLRLQTVTWTRRPTETHNTEFKWYQWMIVNNTPTRPAVYSGPSMTFHTK